MREQEAYSLQMRARERERERERGGGGGGGEEDGYSARERERERSGEWGVILFISSLQGALTPLFLHGMAPFRQAGRELACLPGPFRSSYIPSAARATPFQAGGPQGRARRPTAADREAVVPLITFVLIYESFPSQVQFRPVGPAARRAAPDTPARLNI